MRRPALFLALMVLLAAPVRADVAFIELTPANVNDLPFEFTFSHSAAGDSVVVLVEIRPRNLQVSETCKQVGGRLYHCQEDPDRIDLNMNDMGARQTGNSLIYTLRVPKKSKTQCFYFWFMDATMPGGDAYWISLDSPLLRDRKHARH
jgi:hypothetical protein